MSKNQIEIVTRHTKGGSWKWGKELAQKINEDSPFKAHLADTLADIFKNHFFTHADLVHGAYPLWPRLYKKPFVLTIHGNFRKEGWRQKFFYPKAIRSADIVTVPSNFLKIELNLERVRVVPNAVDANEFNQVPFRQNLDNPKILTVMNFNFWHKAKGVIEIAKVLSGISHEKRQSIEYTIVGDGPERPKIQNEIGRLKSDFLKINFAGFDDPKKYYANADLFAYVSGFDNMPISIMEAMAAGLPVAANQIGAIPEIITNGVDGLLSLDPENYKYNVNKLLEDSELRMRLGQAAREKIKQKFDWSVILPQWINIYSELLK